MFGWLIPYKACNQLESSSNLTIQDFRRTFGEEADGRANVGHGKLTLVPNENSGPPLLRLACRETHRHPAGEQELLAHIINVVTSAGYAFSHALIVNYYVSLKTNPFV